MKIGTINLIFFLFFAPVFGQTNIYFEKNSIDHSLNSFKKFHSSLYWHYKLDLNFKSDYPDSIKPLGLLTFYRTQNLNDSFSTSIKSKLWEPSIQFEIFRLPDSTFCKRKTHDVYMFSSCVPPNVGGDLITVGNFIFINRDVCVSCADHSSNQDQCRPVVLFAFESVIDKNVINIEDIVKQFKFPNNTLIKRS